MSSDKETPAQIERGKITIILAGQTGVGRSTLINMITGADDGSERAVKVSNDVRPCTIENTVHIASLEVDGNTLNCNFSDTRGLDEAAADHPSLVDKATNWILRHAFRLSKYQYKRDIQKSFREHIDDLKDGDTSGSQASIVILMWCIHASKIEVLTHWQNFREAYVYCCQKRVKPVVVITQMTLEFEKDWEERCKRRLDGLDLGIGSKDKDDLLLMVRRYGNPSSKEYKEDCLSLRRLIFRLSATGTDCLPSHTS